MTITRATLTVGRDISLPQSAGRECHYIIAESLSELGQFARASRISSYMTSREWDANLGLERALTYCTTGDTSSVTKSEALLDKMESHLQMPSTRSVWVDDISGAFPNIPAYIAGQPLNMRNRIRAQTDSAPLCIMVDLGISAAITAQQARTRGIAILALVRALSARRPIELWACDFGDSNRTDAVFCGAKISTTPLDLAEASYALTHPAFVRTILFGLERVHHSFTGGWPFSLNRALTRAEMETLLAPIFTHTSETLALPGLHISDQSVTDPEAWLKRQISEHDPLTLEELP